MNTQKRVGHIDGLRAVAAMSVVVFHAGVHSPTKPVTGSLLETLLRSGAHGVDLFFVLSGFCLAYPALSALRAKGNTTFSLTAFGARRLVRILPPYYAAILLFFAAGLVLIRHHVALPQSMDPRSVSVTEVFKQMLFAGHHYLASPFWTLAIEFRWYFIFPIVLLVWTRSRVLFGLIAVLSLIASGTAIHSNDLFFLPIFMLGIVAADIYISGSPLALLALPALPLALLAALGSTAQGGWYFLDRGPAWGIAMFCLVVAVGAVPMLRNLLTSRGATVLGAASYSIYLIHEPILEWIERLHLTAIPPAAQFAVAVAGATLAGLAFSLIAERPFVEGGLKPLLCGRIQQSMEILLAFRGSRVALNLSNVRHPLRLPRDGKAAA